MAELPLDIIACPYPGCTAPAEVKDRHTSYSTAGEVEMVRCVCLVRHIYYGPSGGGTL